MKRVLALVLTMLMVLSLATVAFAVEDYSDKYSYDLMLDNDDDLGSEGQMLPGVAYEFKLQEGSGDPMVSIDSDFKLSVEYNEGKKYVKSISRTDGRIVVKLNSDISYGDGKDIDVDITLTAVRDIKKRVKVGSEQETVIVIAKGDSFDYNISETIADERTEVEPVEDIDDVNIYLGDDADTIYYTDGEKGYVGFSAGERDFQLIVKMGRSSQIYIDIDTNDISAVYNKYKDVSKANLSYYTFNNAPTISGTGYMSIRKDAYVYEWDGKTLTPVETEDADGRCQWEVTGRLGSYVISDKALTAGSQVIENDNGAGQASGTDKNPDTGR